MPAKDINANWNTASFMIWTQVNNSISYDNNNYVKSTPGK